MLLLQVHTQLSSYEVLLTNLLFRASDMFCPMRSPFLQDVRDILILEQGILGRTRRSRRSRSLQGVASNHLAITHQPQCSDCCDICQVQHLHFLAPRSAFLQMAASASQPMPRRQGLQPSGGTASHRGLDASRVLAITFSY